MDTDLSSLLILLSFFIFLATFLKKITRFKPGPDINLPPGPRKLPFVGNLHYLFSSQPPHRILADLAKKHGQVMHLQLGQLSTVVISSPEAAQEVLKMHDITFANRPWILNAAILFYQNSDIAFSSYGEYWRQLRKICTIELLSLRRVQSYQPLREGEFSNMCKWIASKEGSLINLTEKICSSTCDIVMQASLGNKTKELAAFASLTKDISDHIMGNSMEDFYPSISLFRLFNATRGSAKRLHERQDSLLENIINDHKAAKDECQQQEALVDVLLKYNEAGQEPHLTIENIKAVIQDMFNAGIDTSSMTTDWAMAEILKHPTVLKKAQDEVRLVFKDKGFVDESGLDELKYLKLVVKESLRMHPPAPLLIPRENSQQCEIHGYKIPLKTRVMVNAWAIGRDPKYWKEPDAFIPERFIDNPVDYKSNNFEYIPFGAGRRICPGISFGLANVELPLAMLLFHFDWVFPDGMKPENVDMTETLGITSRRKVPLLVIPIVKNPLPVK